MNEKEVTDIMVDFLSKQHNIVERGEINLTNDSKSFSADIVCKNERYEMTLAVECKGSTDVFIRDGIGQALCFKYMYGRPASLAADFSKRLRKVVKQLPLYGYDCYEDGSVDCFTTPEEAFDTNRKIVTFEEYDKLLRRTEELEQKIKEYKNNED